MKSFVIVFALVALAQANIDWDNLKQRDVNPIIKGFPTLRNIKNKNNGRVVGGDEATPHQFPYQAGLILTLGNGQQAFCGGSLISPNVVLTAAHCADGIKSVEVILGAHRVREEEPTQVRMVSTDVIVHERWSRLLLKNDIALIKLPENVELNENISLISLPSRSDENNKFTSDTATVSGWGKDSDSASGISPVLRYTSNPVITNLKCSLSYPFVIQSTNVCVSGSDGKSACNGDSGGPLTVDVNGQVTQIGLVSFGRAQGCEHGYPAVYTRITEYLDWISTNAGITID